MPKFTDALRHWPSPDFPRALKQELEQLAPGALPLDKATTLGGFIDDSQLTATIFSVAETETAIEAHIGVFFTEILIGCSCGDDPEPHNAYCRLRICIDKQTAAATFYLLAD
jgi:hypothetical protein